MAGSIDRSLLRVVVADDNADAAHGLSMLLDRSGFDVVALAFDGGSAFKCIATEQPHVAILDIALPVMDGYEVAKLVREEVSPAPRLIAVTGLDRTCDRSDAAEAGFDAHFAKPVEWSQLKALLLAYLKTIAL